MKPNGEPDGPHENRFAQADTFDKSFWLSKNPKVTLVPHFGKQINRRVDSVIKGGDVAIDIESRTHNIYDNAAVKKD